MVLFRDAWDEERRRRWTRPDAHLWLAVNPERFGPLDPEVKRILDEQYELRRGHSSARRRAEEAAARAGRDAQERDLIARMRVENEVLRDEIQAMKAALLGAKANFNPAQPRDEIGRWTDAGGGHANNRPAAKPINDPRVVSDATPDNDWNPGAQYAQSRPRTPTIIRVGDRFFQLEGGQAARLAEAQSRAEATRARVRELDSQWQPRASTVETPEGLIRAYEAEAEQGAARLAELARNGLGPGPFARESIPARGPERDFFARERLEITRIGRLRGCHTCGTLESGTVSGNFICDHQIPSALNILGRPQRLYPQCLTCSARQGWTLGIGKGNY